MRLRRAILMLHHTALAVTAALAVALGGGITAVLVQALGPAIAVASWPTGFATLHHGLAWTWPLAVVALGALTARVWPAATRFAELVLRARNVWIGSVVGIAGFALARVVIATGVVALISPERLQFPLAGLAWTAGVIAVFVAIAGRVVQNRVRTASGLTPGLWAAGWAVTWRTFGMTAPLLAALLLVVAALIGVSLGPGFALASALSEFSDLGPALGASPFASAVQTLLQVGAAPLVVLTGAFTMLYTLMLMSVVPGHVFWRTVEQLYPTVSTPTATEQTAPAAEAPAARHAPRPRMTES